MNAFSRVSLLFFAVCLPLSAASALPLAIGPAKVDARDLTGDEAYMQGDLHSVWTGTHGVAVWMTWAKGIRMRLMAAKFGPDGTLLGSPMILADDLPAGDGKSTTGLSYSSGTVLVTWQTSQQEVLTRRLSPDLQWLDPLPFVLVPWTPGPFRPQAYIATAANASRHAILLTEPRLEAFPALKLIRLGNGAGDQPESVPVPALDPTLATIAARPEGFLIAWHGRTSENQVVEVSTIGLTGNTFAPVQAVTNPYGLTEPGSYSISAAPFGDGYAVAWTQVTRENVSSYPEFPRYWCPLNAAGVPAGAARELFVRSPGAPRELFSLPSTVKLQADGAAVVALSGEPVPENRPPYQRVVRRVLDPATGAGEPALFGEPQGMMPETVEILDTGSGLLAVGEARANAAFSYRRAAVATPLTTDLTLSPQQKLLSQGAPEQQASAVACRGTDYLVVWQDGRNGHSHAAEIRGRLLTLSGTPAGPSFLISNSVLEDISPAVAASGDKYLVAWSVNEGNVEDDNVRAALVTGNGVVSPSFALGASPDREENGVAVAGGANGGFFAAWRSGGVEPDDIYGAWIDTGGSVFPENGFPVAVSPNKERAVSVAGGATTYGITWRDGYGHGLANIHAAVIPASPPGSPVTPERVSFTENTRAHAPEIAWNGSHYRIVWRSLDSAGMQSATLTEDRTPGLPVFFGDPGLEPAVAASGGVWHAFWYHSSDESNIMFTSFNAAGDAIERNSFAPRFVDVDSLSVAAGPDGGILIVYPTSRNPGTEWAPLGIRMFTGGIETVLLYPALPAADPAPRIVQEGEFTTLRWKPDPYFPPDARVWETGTGLEQWLPLQTFPLVLPVHQEGAEASVIFPSFSGARRFFRMTSSLAGLPQ